MTTRDLVKLVVCILVCQGAGVLGSAFTSGSVRTWYEALEKPSFTPPNWVFAPVWITMYALMGVALFLVWRKGLRRPRVKSAVGIFLIQLVLNALWSYLFFGIHRPWLAMAEIVLLWLAIALTTARFFPHSRTAGVLMTPYLAWVTFAALLNGAIAALNSGSAGS